MSFIHVEIFIISIVFICFQRPLCELGSISWYIRWNRLPAKDQETDWHRFARILKWDAQESRHNSSRMEGGQRPLGYWTPVLQDWSPRQLRWSPCRARYIERRREKTQIVFPSDLQQQDSSSYSRIKWRWRHFYLGGTWRLGTTGFWRGGTWQWGWLIQCVIIIQMIGIKWIRTISFSSSGHGLLKCRHWFVLLVGDDQEGELWAVEVLWVLEQVCVGWANERASFIF